MFKMSERKAQARKEFGKSCDLPKDAPEYLKQKGNTAHPELIEMVQKNHALTMQAVTNIIGGRILLKDNGC
jgi:hypothetical protein